MRIDVMTLFPEMFGAVRDYGIPGRALARGLLALHCWNPRDYAGDPHRNVDDRPYGGGPGMVLMAEPLERCLDAVQEDRIAPGPVIYLSPGGRRLDHRAVVELASGPDLILLAGRYAGVDQRFIDRRVDDEWSIGDYVLSGGELAAMVLIEAIVRQLTGALGNEASAACDSFATGLLDGEHYTRPECWAGERVPEVLLSGDHEAIRRWRRKQAVGRTWLRRPELLQQVTLDAESLELLREFRSEHRSSEKST